MHGWFLETDCGYVQLPNREAHHEWEAPMQAALQILVRHLHGRHQKNWLCQWYLPHHWGLYSGQELNAEFHSDKDKKIAYLQKIIRLVELMTGAAVEAKPQKIVAGLEPEVSFLLLRQLMSFSSRCTNAPPVENLQTPMSIKFWARETQNLRRRRRRRK